VKCESIVANRNHEIDDERESRIAEMMARAKRVQQRAERASAEELVPQGDGRDERATASDAPLTKRRQRS
jgi:hypothetical protein